MGLRPRRKPRREAASEPGRQRVFKFVSLFRKKIKKACHSFAYPVNPGRITPEKVLTRFWRFRYKGRFTLKSTL